MPIDPALLSRIQNDAVRRLTPTRRAATNLHVIDDVVRARADIMAHRQRITVDRDTVVVFADDEPMANWGHECRYLLYDARTGARYREVSARFPPFLVDPPPQFRAFHTPVVLERPAPAMHPLPRLPRFPLRVRDGRRYAVLYSGASNYRHVNDLEFLWRTLVDEYGFAPADIQVLNYDGAVRWSGTPAVAAATWPGDGTAYRMKVTGPGTRAAFEAALGSLAAKLKAPDALLIHVNNHGGHDGASSYICAHSGPDYTAPDFAAKLAAMPAYRDLMVVMEQCHSGGFNDLVVEKSTAEKTTFAAAATEHRSSIGGAHFDPFARDWIAAMARNDAYGGALGTSPDTSGEGKVSSLEAFHFADAMHHSYDTPVYCDRGDDADSQCLAQRWRYLWVIRDVVLREIERFRAERHLTDAAWLELEQRVVAPALTRLDDEDLSRVSRADLEARALAALRAALR